MTRSPNGAGPPDSPSANDRQELTTGGEPLHLMHSFGRKCAKCGRMTWPGMVESAARWTEDSEEWSAATDNCRRTR